MKQNPMHLEIGSYVCRMLLVPVLTHRKIIALSL